MSSVARGRGADEMGVKLYSIQWDKNVAIIGLTMAGFWQDGDVATFAADLRHAIGSAQGDGFDMIADLSALAPQSKAVVALQGDVIASLVTAGMKRLVIVGAGALLTMQVKRAAGSFPPHFVATNIEARQWLARSTGSDR